MLQQIHALTHLLQQTVSKAGQEPFKSLPILAVSFTTSHIQESASGLSASRTSEKVQEAYSALLEQAVSQMQLLGEVFEQEENRDMYKGYNKAQEGLYGLLEALAKVHPLHGCVDACWMDKLITEIICWQLWCFCVSHQCGRLVAWSG